MATAIIIPFDVTDCSDVGGQVTPICENDNDLDFEEKQFNDLISIDSYHYFASHKRFSQENILLFIGKTVTIA